MKLQVIRCGTLPGPIQCANSAESDGKRQLVALVVRSTRGEPKLLYQNFTYNRSYFSKKDTHIKWYCSSRNSKKCKVNVVTDLDHNILHVFGPVLIKTKRKGQYVLLYKSHTYSRSAKSKKGLVWKCTLSKSEECKARMTTDDNLNVVAKKGEHSHKPPERESKPKHVYFST